MKEQVKVMFILWFALLSSQVIHLVVGHVAAPDIPEGSADVFVTALSILAMITLFAATCLYAFLVVRPLNELRGALTKELLAKVFTMSILTWALIESVSVYGLFVRFQGAELAGQLRFAVAAAGAHVLCGPWHPRLRAGDQDQDL